jgi:hypothetical protein
MNIANPRVYRKARGGKSMGGDGLSKRRKRHAGVRPQLNNNTWIGRLNELVA